MNHQQALNEVLAGLDTSASIQIGFDQVERWQAGVLDCFLKLNLLKLDAKSGTIVCTGCEYRCQSEVFYSESFERAFVVCEQPDMQEHMGRILIPVERLQQWQASTRQVATLLCKLLSLTTNPEYKQQGNSYRLGMLQGKAGRRWVNLHDQPLRLVVGEQSLLLEEVLYFDDSKLMLDETRLQTLLSGASTVREPAYQPNTTRREARKLATQTMYMDWNDAYQQLQKEQPDKPDTWYARCIAKLPIAKGKSVETIRKNMKKPK